MNSASLHELSEIETLEYIEKFISEIRKKFLSKILLVLLGEFTILRKPISPESDAQAIEIPLLSFADTGKIQTKRYGDHEKILYTWDNGSNKKLIDQTFAKLQENLQPRETLGIMISFRDYIRNLLDIDRIDFSSNFFALLPEKSQEKIILHHMKKRLRNTGITMNDLDGFLEQYRHVIGNDLWEIDTLMWRYIWLKRPGGHNLKESDLQKFQLLMKLPNVSWLMNSIMPSIARYGDSASIVKQLIPLEQQYEELPDGFSFHIENGTLAMNKSHSLLKTYYEIFVYDLLKRYLKVTHIPSVQFSRLDTNILDRESVIWGMINPETEIDKGIEVSSFLRALFSFENEVLDQERQSLIFEVFREIYADINRAIESKNAPITITEWLISPDMANGSYGVFWASGFHGDSMFCIDSKDSDQKRILACIDNFSIDDFLYLILQINMIIETSAKWNKHDLYSQIMRAYNAQLLWDNEVFDTSGTKEYPQVVEHIIFPHSSINSIKHHALFLGLPGTGKSQQMFNLLTRENFVYKNQNFHIQSLVIPIKIDELMEILKSWSGSSIGLRISQIAMKTWKHLILLVEDIDSMTFEPKDGTNPLAQALTNLFDWLWKTGQFTLIASSNHPESIPKRLVRKWRFDTVIIYDVLKTSEEIQSALEIYIGKYSLESMKNQLFSFIPQMIGFTYSNVADFLGKIVGKISLKEYLNQDSMLSDEELIDIFTHLHVSRWDFNAQEHIMKEWLNDVRNGDPKLSDRELASVL